jgi:hypothetical protein
MKVNTLELSGRYTVGAVLYLRPGSPYEAQAWDEPEFVAAQVTPEWETVSKADRKGMAAEQIAALTTVRVVSVRGATNAQRAVSEASEGSVGLCEASVCEVCEAPGPIVAPAQAATFTDHEGVVYTRVPS